MIVNVLVFHAFLMIMYYTIVKILLNRLFSFLFDQNPSNNTGDLDFENFKWEQTICKQTYWKHKKH